MDGVHGFTQQTSECTIGSCVLPIAIIVIRKSLWLLESWGLYEQPKVVIKLSQIPWGITPLASQIPIKYQKPHTAGLCAFSITSWLWIRLSRSNQHGMKTDEDINLQVRLQPTGFFLT